VAGHAALAHETRDAVFAAAQLVSALQSITARETSPRDLLVLGVASIAGGETANVVTNEVTLRGTVRWLDTTVRERALTRMDEIAAGVCAALRVAYRLDVTATFPVMREGSPLCRQRRPVQAGTDRVQECVAIGRRSLEQVDRSDVQVRGAACVGEEGRVERGELGSATRPPWSRTTEQGAGDPDRCLRGLGTVKCDQQTTMAGAYASLLAFSRSRPHPAR
jgi:hypothetical protein